MLDIAWNKILVYDLETGKYIHSVALDYSIVESYHLQVVGNKLYADAVPLSSNIENSFLLQEVNMKTGKTESSSLNAKDYNRGWNESLTKNESFFYSRNDVCPKYIQMFMDTVIAICEDSLQPFLVVKTNNWANVADIEQMLLFKKENDGFYDYDVLNEKRRIFNISQFVEFGNMIYFNCEQQMKKYHILFNTATEKTFISQLFYDDLIYSKTNNYINSIFCCSDGNGLYAYIDPNAMTYFIDFVKDGILRDDLDKRDVLMNLSEDSNPVLFYYKN